MCAGACASRIEQCEPIIDGCASSRAVPDQAQNALSSSQEHVMTSDDCRFCCTNAGPMPQGESRRDFLLGAAAAAGGLLAAPRRAAAAELVEAAPLFAYIGCFTSERRKAHSKGISVYRIDLNGSWSLVEMLETLPNPQFITFDQRQKFLYSVHGDGTEVSSYAIDKTSGRISFLNKQPTSGNKLHPPHAGPDEPVYRHRQRHRGRGVSDQFGWVACSV
jgi:hypothetical protein